MASQDISLTIGAPRVLSEQEFNAVRAQVLAAAPTGLDEAGYERYIGPALAAAVAAAEQQPAAPALGLGIEDQLKALATLMTSRTEGVPGAALGAVKGVVGIPGAVQVGRAIHQVPGVSPAVDWGYKMAGQPDVNAAGAMAQMPWRPRLSPDESVLGLQADNGAEKLGKFLEQMAEFGAGGAGAEKLGAMAAEKALPFAAGPATRFAARVLPRMATNAGANAIVTAKQGGDVGTGALVGAATPLFPEAATGASQFLRGKGESLVRSAIKPTVTSMKRVAGASLTGIEAQAQRLTRFIIDNRLTSPEKAQAIIDGVETAIPRLINAVGNPISDAATRAARYLSALGRSAAKQGLPAEDVAIIQGKMKDLLDGPLGKDVTTFVRKPTATGYANQPVTTRALRTDVRAKEALDTARATSKWSTKKSYGEMKGAAKEADKAVERGARDATKRAVPAIKPHLARESKAIQSRDVLDRMKFRQANRDAVSLPAHVIAAGEIAQGRVPVLAFAANWLRDDQLKAGIYADALANAIKNKNVERVTKLLGRLGVSRGLQATHRRQAPSR